MRSIRVDPLKRALWKSVASTVNNKRLRLKDILDWSYNASERLPEVREGTVLVVADMGGVDVAAVIPAEADRR